VAAGAVRLPILACATDAQLGHSLLGYHDGIDSWTVNVAADGVGARQTFVSAHEAAHHRLHSATPWGLAVLATGVPATDRVVATTRWLQLLEACRRTHEVYATWASAELSEGEAFFAENLLYAAYLRDARALAEAISAQPLIAARGLDLLVRLVMAPVALGELDLALLRSPETQFERDQLPDHRLALLESRLEGSSLQLELRKALAVPPNSPLELDRVFTAVEEIGLGTMTFADQAEWTERIVAQLSREHPDRYAVVPERSADQLTDALDDQQRERIQMHDEPLPLRIVEPEGDGRFPVESFTRLAEGIGKHVWLAWLHPDFLRRQFLAPDLVADEPVLGLLSCDRVHGPAHASWFAFPTVPPGLGARAVASGDVVPLLFTTLRSIDATAAEVDFRGFEPAFVLIDSDLLAFLQRSIEDEQPLIWSVVGSEGSRTIDILVFERSASPGVLYLHVCSAPTGRLTAAWLIAHEGSCSRDDRRFDDLRSRIWALVEHLIGTLWMFDLHGYNGERSA
jgi:hypothetical protein